jgi:SAM-dependent methyltransferase
MTTLNENQLQNIADKYNLSYHIPYFRQFLTEFNPEGKDILEVGGLLPKELVIDLAKSNYWLGIESRAYEQELGGNANQQSNIPESNSLSHQRLIVNVEDYVDGNEEKFDCIFSIACFEHIGRFPEALNSMWRLLKSGGCLFSMYSPIWSSYGGHHLMHVKLPEQFKDYRPDGTILNPWEHISLPRFQLHNVLKSRYDAAFADELVWQIFNSTHINRYFFEDYIYTLQNSKFVLEKVFGTFNVPIDERTQNVLESTNVGYKNFSNQGIYLFIRK